jgi:ribosomal-protein-serine acetyltransferase
MRITFLASDQLADPSAPHTQVSYPASDCAVVSVSSMLSHQIGPALVRDLEPWHADELADFFQRSGADLYEWLPWERFESSEATKKFLTSFAERRAADTGCLYGLWLDGVLVGGTLFPSINVGAGTAELGVFLAKDARGQGIVTRTGTPVGDR